MLALMAASVLEHGDRLVTWNSAGDASQLTWLIHSIFGFASRSRKGFSVCKQALVRVICAGERLRDVLTMSLVGLLFLDAG